jgi:hypothetical protein
MCLNPETFEEVEADSHALGQAILVVIAFSFAAGIGLARPSTTSHAVLAMMLGSLTGWISWASLVYYLGVRLFPEPQTRAEIGQLARTIGFSAAPGLFFPLLALQMLRPATFTVIVVWMAAAMVIAVRQALDFTSTLRAVGVCLAAGALAGLIALAAGFAFGPAAY